MNGTRHHIEIIQPFHDAIELTKTILFRPFDFNKWCVIGFAAFLANLAGGGLNFPNFGNWGSNRSHETLGQPWRDMGLWAIPLLLALFLVILAIAFTLLWLGCRGRFIFTDCIVRNRGAIAVPWREYRREGNSLFLFTVVVGLIFMTFLGLLAVPVVLLWMSTEKDGTSIPGLIALLVAIPIFLVVVIGWALAAQFILPAMYRQRCTATAAFRQALAVLKEYPGELVLYIFFCAVLAIGTALLVVVAICGTCCIAAIPYVGTVIMLPIFVCFRSYLLLFARQFGSEFDAWGGITPDAPPVQLPPPEPPPPAEPPAPVEPSSPESFAPPENPPPPVGS